MPTALDAREPSVQPAPTTPDRPSRGIGAFGRLVVVQQRDRDRCRDAPVGVGNHVHHPELEPPVRSHRREERRQVVGQIVGRRGTRARVPRRSTVRKAGPRSYGTNRSGVRMNMTFAPSAYAAHASTGSASLGTGAARVGSMASHAAIRDDIHPLGLPCTMESRRTPRRASGRPDARVASGSGRCRPGPRRR